MRSEYVMARVRYPLGADEDSQNSLWLDENLEEFSTEKPLDIHWLPEWMRLEKNSLLVLEEKELQKTA
jgi:hypothetical protein